MSFVTPLRNDPFVFPVKTKFDDIVQKDSFRPDSENIKDFRSGLGSPSNAGNPVYDSELDSNFSLDSESFPSKALSALREGRVDKAETQLYLNSLESSSKEKAAFEAAEIASKERNAALDEILGVNSDPQDSSNIS